MFRGKIKFASLVRALNNYFTVDPVPGLAAEEVNGYNLEETIQNWQAMKCQLTQAVNQMEFAVLLYRAEYELAQKNYEEALEKYTQLRLHAALETLSQSDPTTRQRVWDGANRAFWYHVRLSKNTPSQRRADSQDDEVTSSTQNQ
jgi:hypothetical protein